jgi:signal transduction histidine kinase/ActR/RegA family two-component response regulator
VQILPGELEQTAEAAHRRTTFLASVGTALLSSTLSFDETLARVARMTVDAVADFCAIDLPYEGLESVLHADPAKLPLLQQLPRFPALRGMPRVLTTGDPELYQQTTDEVLQDITHEPQYAELLRQLDVKSMMIVPIQARGDTIGTMILASTQDERSFSEDDVEMAQRLAQKTAFAVENARLFRRERQARALIEQAAERMGRLQGLTADLARALTSEAVAQAVIDHAAAGVGAVTAALWTLDPDGQHLRLLRSWNYSPEAQQAYAVLDVKRSSPASDAVRTRDPVFLSSRLELEQRYPAVAAAAADNLMPSIIALACLPLMVGEEVTGVLIFTLRDRSALAPEERVFLTVAAGHCAQSLYRARIFEAERRASTEKALLYELVDAAGRAHTLEEVYEHALTALQRALDVQRTSISLFEPDQVIRFKAWHGLSDAYRAALEGHSPWSPETRDAAPVIVSDVAADPELARYREVFEREGIVAIAFLPLVHQQRLLGKLMIYASRPRSFTPAELAMARSVATQVAQAVARKMTEAEVARLFEEAETARAQAEDASRMKDEFLAVVSHELRTPMSAILGWSHILKTERRNEPATLSKGIDVIERNARAQTKIIEDILDVSRVITGKLVIEPVSVSLSSVVSEAIDVVRPSAAAKETTLSLDAPDDPLSIVGDPGRLRQIIWNLLSNAVKFTPRGGSVQVALTQDTGSVSVAVRDTGKGIPPSFLPHVFERFRQADSSTTRLTGGLGLGLAIVRHLVELHGGHVQAASEGSDKGATFTVTLPVRAAGTTTSPNLKVERSTGTARRLTPERNSSIQLAGIKILVVDDETDAREMLSTALSGYGAEMQTVSTARAALKVLPLYQPRILISDIGMPEEDGYVLIRQVRALAPPYGKVPAIALTAYARPEDRMRALAAGYDEHVAKPAQPDALASLVARMIGRA